MCFQFKFRRSVSLVQPIECMLPSTKLVEVIPIWMDLSYPDEPLSIGQSMSRCVRENEHWQPTTIVTIDTI